MNITNIPIFDSEICKQCRYGSPHVSRCFDDEGYCIHFPYVMHPQTSECFVMKEVCNVRESDLPAP